MALLAPIDTYDEYYVQRFNQLSSRPKFQRFGANYQPTPKLKRIVEKNDVIWNPIWVQPLQTGTGTYLTDWESRWKPWIDSLYGSANRSGPPPYQPFVGVAELTEAEQPKPRLAFLNPRLGFTSPTRKENESVAEFKSITATTRHDCVKIRDFRDRHPKDAKVDHIRVIKRSPGQGLNHATGASKSNSHFRREKRKLSTRIDDPIDSVERLRKRRKRFGEEQQSDEPRNDGLALSLNEFIKEGGSMGVKSPPRRKLDFEDSKFFCHDHPSDLRKYLNEKRLSPRAAKTDIRPVIIDGSNIAYSCGAQTPGRQKHQKIFDCNGLRLCVDFFLNLGCTDIQVVLPESRYYDKNVVNGHILQNLQDKQRLILSSSKRLRDGSWVSSYDDRLILEIAEKKDGVVVSNDRFDDLRHEKREWRHLISERRLGYSIYEAKGKFHFYVPPDPLGRWRKSLKEILRY